MTDNSWCGGLSNFLQDHSSSHIFKKCAMSLLRKLSHVTIIYQDGHSYLNSLTTFISTFTNDFVPRYCTISIYLVVTHHRGPYQNRNMVNVTGHEEVYQMPISSRMSVLGKIWWENANFRWLIINFCHLGFLWPLVTKCMPKSRMNPLNLCLFCWKFFHVTASKGTYRNAESIKCVTVTGPYRIDRNRTVSKLLQADISHSLVHRGDAWDMDISVDASKMWGIVVIDDCWDAWQWKAPWHFEGRNIGWAETIAIKLVTWILLQWGLTNTVILIHGDNQGIIGSLSWSQKKLSCWSRYSSHRCHCDIL